MVSSPSRYHPTKARGYRHQCSGVIMSLTCCLISQGHMMIRSSDFMGWSPSRQVASYHPAKFGGHSQSDSGVNNDLSLSRDLGRPRDQRVM